MSPSKRQRRTPPLNKQRISLLQSPLPLFPVVLLPPIPLLSQQARDLSEIRP